MPNTVAVDNLLTFAAIAGAMHRREEVAFHNQNKTHLFLRRAWNWMMARAATSW